MYTAVAAALGFATSLFAEVNFGLSITAWNWSDGFDKRWKPCAARYAAPDTHGGTGKAVMRLWMRWGSNNSMHDMELRRVTQPLRLIMWQER